jgi:predicted enzyme related to lactoylglutathione lyase
MTNRLDTILCEVRDMTLAIAFYKAILGAEPTLESPHWTSFDLSGVTLGIHPRYSAETAPGGGWVVGIRVESLESVRSVLSSLGREPAREHEIPGGKLLEFTDLDGNRIQAIERA